MSGRAWRGAGIGCLVLLAGAGALCWAGGFAQHLQEYPRGRVELPAEVLHFRLRGCWKSQGRDQVYGSPYDLVIWLEVEDHDSRQLKVQGLVLRTASGLELGLPEHEPVASFRWWGEDRWVASFELGGLTVPAEDIHLILEYSVDDSPVRSVQAEMPVTVTDEWLTLPEVLASQ